MTTLDQKTQAQESLPTRTSLPTHKIAKPISLNMTRPTKNDPASSSLSSQPVSLDAEQVGTTVGTESVSVQAAEQEDAKIPRRIAARFVIGSVPSSQDAKQTEQSSKPHPTDQGMVTPVQPPLPVAMAHQSDGASDTPQLIAANAAPSLPPPGLVKTPLALSSKEKVGQMVSTPQVPPPFSHQNVPQTTEKVQARLPEKVGNLLKPEKKDLQTLKAGSKQRRYLAQSVVLEESGLSHLVRMSLSFIVLVVILFFVWASFSTIEEMAPSTGEVMPAGPVQMIQHLEGGIVKSILVKEGDLVEEGHVLFRMAPESAMAEFNQMRARHAALESQAARNRAFLEEKEPDFQAVPEEFSHLNRDQSLLLKAQRAFRESRREVLRIKIEQRRSRIGNLLTQQDVQGQQLSYFEEEVAMRQAGVAKGVMSRLTALSSEKERNRVIGDLTRIRGELATAYKELDEANKQLSTLDDELRQDVFKELGGISAELSQLREGMLRQKNRVERLEVLAPVKGVIKNLQMETLRGVVPPGGLLTEIVPVQSTRKVETHISTRDVGHVKVGQRVTVKVTTYDFARYGGIDGVLESISATTFKSPTDPTPYYKGIIRLDQAYVGNHPKSNEVLPGMTVQADIHTGSKTLMEYMLKPIYASVNKAFRER
ncbi:MAG: HlyD family type I secretion periplasmic adaptor subunit [Magnetococcus sp. YQC-5]